MTISANWAGKKATGEGAGWHFRFSYLRAVNRLMGYILLLIVAVAAFTPCCTGDEHNEDAAVANPSDAKEGDDGCSCSPFFACATCTGFVSTAKAISIPAPAEYRLSWFEGALPRFSSAYTSTPWQPPRAG